MRKKFTMLLAALSLVMGTAWAQVYQKVPHAKWTVTALSEAGVYGNEGGVAHIKDENAKTFYHSNYGGPYDGRTEKKGKDGLQAFLVEMAESFTFDKVTYTGRSDNNSSGWARKVRIYVYETLPAGFEALSGLTYEAKEEMLKRTDNTVLGDPAFDNNDDPWANDMSVKTAEFATPQTGKYILFVMDESTDGWLTCSDFHLWQKVEGIESDKGYYLKIQDLDGYYLNVKTGNTISKTTEKIAAYLTLNDGYWHISALPDRNNNFVGVSTWNATTGQKIPANWNIYKKGDYWILSQATYFGSAGNDYHYLGANNGSISTEENVYTDKPTSQAVKIIFEEVPTVDVTLNYYDGEDKVNTIIGTFVKDAAIQIGDVPTMDFYADYAFKSEGDITAVEDAAYDISCRADFPFELSTVDANGNVNGTWYKLNADKGNKKVAYTYGTGRDANRVDFVDDNDNAKGYWAFVRVAGTAYKFNVYNLGRPGLPMAAVKYYDNQSNKDNYNWGLLYMERKANAINEFVVSKNGNDYFNLQIAPELINNNYATAGNHIEGHLGFWSSSGTNPLSSDGSKLSVEAVSTTDLDLAKASAKIAWRYVVWGEGFPNFTTTYNETSIASFEALDALIDAATTVDEVNTIAAELEENAPKYCVRMYNAGRNKANSVKFYVSGSNVVENGNLNSMFWYDMSCNLQQVTSGEYLVHSTELGNQNIAYSLTGTQSEASVFTFTTTTAVEGAWSVYDGFGYMCDWGNTNKVFSHNKQSDTWATWMVEFEDVARVSAWIELNEYLDYFEGEYYDAWSSNPDYKWRDQKGVNNYTIGFSGALTLEEYFNKAKGVADVFNDVNDYAEEKEILEGLETWLEINLPEEGKFYRIRNTSNSNYLKSTTNNEGKLTVSGGTGDVAIFYYTGNALLSYTQGLYMNDRKFNEVGVTSDVVFSEATNGDRGCYIIEVGTDRYIYGKNASLDSGAPTTPDDPTTLPKDRGYNWWLEEVTTLPVKVGAAGWGTFYTPVAVTVPTTVKAYTITAVGEKATLTPVEGTVPAGTGLILEGKGTHDFAIATEDAVGFEKGLLLGAAAKTYVTAEANTTYYVLAKPEGAADAGLYKAKLDKNEGTAFLNGANKVYLPVTTEQGAPAMFAFTRGDEENTTGIESVEANEELVIFDLAGRRVQKMEKGIYIVNGKKVIK